MLSNPSSHIKVSSRGSKPGERDFDGVRYEAKAGRQLTNDADCCKMIIPGCQ